MQVAQLAQPGRKTSAAKIRAVSRAWSTLGRDLDVVRQTIGRELGLTGGLGQWAVGSAPRLTGIRQALRSRHIVRYAIHGAGKLVRPALLILSARACGSVGVQHFRFAAAVELVHGASLAHDDVLDQAVERRHRATLNARWGNELAILSGDMLFANAFRLAAGSPCGEAARILARASCLTCLGETEQTFCEKGRPLTEERYLAIAEMKTGSVFSAACELGALLSLVDASSRTGRGSRPDRVSAGMERVTRTFAEFGRNFGIAYQLADDIVDLVGSEREAGKTLRRDLACGKMTLPLIRLLGATRDARRRRSLERAMKDCRSAAACRKIARAARESGIVRDTATTVREYVDRAKRCLVDVEESVWQDMLRAAVDSILEVEKGL
ncbi:MAG: polyprenyl synthetase family protein [Planctomycetota bacterium]|nr:polyprenyl synthetase family protein [Planctomycetota bacterium]